MSPGETRRGSRKPDQAATLTQCPGPTPIKLCRGISRDSSCLLEPRKKRQRSVEAVNRCPDSCDSDDSGDDDFTDVINTLRFLFLARGPLRHPGRYQTRRIPVRSIRRKVTRPTGPTTVRPLPVPGPRRPSKFILWLRLSCRRAHQLFASYEAPGL